MTQISGTRPDESIGAGLLRINGYLLAVIQDKDQDINDFVARAVHVAWLDYDFDADECWQEYLASKLPRRFSARYCAKLVLTTPLIFPLSILLGVARGIQEYVELWGGIWEQGAGGGR